MRTSEAAPADCLVRHRLRFTAIAAILALALPALSRGQGAAGATGTTSASAFDYTKYLKLTSVPSVLQGPAAALGNRLQKPGNERITMTGTLTDQSGTSRAQITIENGGKFNLTFSGGPSAGGTEVVASAPSTPVIFNGTSASGTSVRSNQDGVLESFVDDLADTLGIVTK